MGISLVATGPVAGAKSPAADPSVITAWNAIAVSTITGAAPNGAGKANAEAFIWFPFVHAAMYNAVQGITGEYELYRWNTRAPKGASPQAAAAVAAHRILKHYFGATGNIGVNLDASLADSLDDIAPSVSKAQGIRYGRRAADRIIQLRLDDGRNAAVVFSPTLAPGVWRPTPPAEAPFFNPWMARLDPFTLDSPSQFRPGPPPPINSATYLTEFAEVRDYGAKTGSLRDPGQEQTALFFVDTAIGPVQAGLRDLATRRALDISDSARLFAAVEMSIADAVIAAWDGKLQYGWWRPITAIRLADDDGNPATEAVPGWEPLVVNPPYPDWPSGLCNVMGALSGVLVALDGRLDIFIRSPGLALTRHYEQASTFRTDAVNARVWSGIHFRTSDVVAFDMGEDVANWALAHYFAPMK